jgi:CheY-like chemotaxis protein
MKKQDTVKGAPLPRRPAAMRWDSQAPLVVLHIDDDANDAELLRLASQSAQKRFSLHIVEDGEEAIAYLSGSGIYSDRQRYQAPTLILLDLKMPRINGLELLRWIRERSEWANVPVVVLSGSQMQEDRHCAYTAGANAYIVKPLGFEALVGFVEKLQSAWHTGRLDTLQAA